MIGALALFFFFLKFSLVKTLGVEGLKKKKKNYKRARAHQNKNLENRTKTHLENTIYQVGF